MASPKYIRLVPYGANDGEWVKVFKIYIYIYSYKTVIKAEQNALIEHTLVTKYSKQLLEILNKRWYG